MSAFDSDPASERFTSYEAEFKLVQADLTQKMTQMPELSGDARKSTLTAAARAVEEGMELLDQMKLEKHNIPSASRGMINQRLRNYDTDMDGYKRKIKTLMDERAALYGRYSDNPNASASDPHYEQRRQLLQGTDRLDRSTQRLKASAALASDTEAIGQSTLADLHRQRETIMHTNDVLLDSEQGVDRSLKTLRAMAQRMATNRIITIAIITVLVLLIFAVIFSKFR